MNSLTPLLAQGLDLQNSGKPELASKVFERALEGDPLNPIALYSLATLRYKAGDFDAALRFFNRAVVSSPHFPQAWFARGVTLRDMGRLAPALRSFNIALAIDPRYLDALINLGALSRDLHQHGDALTAFHKALEVDPNNPVALGNFGIMLTEYKQHNAAILSFEKLLRVAPDYEFAPGLLLYEQLQCSLWKDYYRLKDLIRQDILAGKRSCKTLAVMSVLDSAELQYRCAHIFAKDRYPAVEPPLWRGEIYRHDRMRIGYLSPDFREHPVGQLMAGVLEHHDRTRVEVHALSIGNNDGSARRERLRSACDHFHDVALNSPIEVAQLVRRLEIDILVDLAGYTSDARTMIFAHRAAPTQVNFLGYPGTLAQTYYDFIIGDSHVIPPGHEIWYSETVARMPNCYLPTDDTLIEARETPPRERHGLPATGMVYCSFNHEHKINPEVFDVWMRILKRVDGSVLWLKSHNEESMRNLAREAELRGVSAERIHYAGRVPSLSDHLARYQMADLFLDSFPYNAHTTASDALLSGLPVLTLQGDAFAARVAGSLLHAIGLPELIAETKEDYEAIAVGLGLDAARRAALRAKLVDQRGRTPLFDTARFTRDLEALYVWMQTAPRVRPAAPPVNVAPPPRRAESPAAAPAPIPETPLRTAFGSVENRELPARLSVESMGFLQSISLFRVVVIKDARKAALRAHFGGKRYERILLGPSLGPLEFALPSCSVELLPGDFALRLASEPHKLAAGLADAVVLLTGQDLSSTETMRGYGALYEACPHTLFCIWDRGNGALIERAIFLAAYCDLYAPQSAKHTDLLSRYNWSIAAPLPAAVTQWSRSFLEAQGPAPGPPERRAGPLGRHVAYAPFALRNQTIVALHQQCPDVDFAEAAYHRRSAEDRWREWTSFKCHWIVPSDFDVSDRVFDALVSGGVPILPECLRHHPALSGLEATDAVFHRPSDILDPRAAVGAAIERFDRQGKGGIARRHRFAMERHHGDRRLLTLLRAAAADYGIIGLES